MVSNLEESIAALSYAYTVYLWAKGNSPNSSLMCGRKQRTNPTLLLRHVHVNPTAFTTGEMRWGSLSASRIKVLVHCTASPPPPLWKLVSRGKSSEPKHERKTSLWGHLRQPQRWPSPPYLGSWHFPLEQIFMKRKWHCGDSYILDSGSRQALELLVLCAEALDVCVFQALE